MLISCSPKGQDDVVPTKTKSDIKNTFDNWTKSEIIKGNFFAMDSCNSNYYVMKDSLGLGSIFGFAVPEDMSEINFYYEYLNNDTIVDALITFTPVQCDGGNGSIWLQYKLLVLSQGKDYSITPNYFDKFETEPGFFHLDSVATKTVFGSYFEFTDQDGFCCPSIKRPIKIDLDKNEFIYID